MKQAVYFYVLMFSAFYCTVFGGKHGNGLLKSSGKLNSIKEEDMPYLSHDIFYTTPLHRAAKENNISLVKDFIKNEAYVNAQDGFQDTP
ncbi:ankyrin repeat domain-containing protein, partial [Candidatus Dependentiae bacterium]|nr:ankyrin repeat domain-containing protein [Candidatus Dependentiae bacterium]